MFGFTMKSFSINEINTWERFYRSNFLNSLSGFKPVSLISTINNAGVPNLAIFSNIVHIGADPALIGFVNRPIEAAPHTLSNIKSTGLYTINHLHPSFLSAAHQTSAKYAEGLSEFNEVGLTPEYKENMAVPFVKESHVQYSLELFEVIPLSVNNTFFVIGTLKYAFVDESIISSDGFLDLSKAGSMVSLGLDAYYNTNFEARYKNAKPGTEASKIMI